jgi:hypothetical protein
VPDMCSKLTCAHLPLQGRFIHMWSAGTLFWYNPLD